MLKCPVCNVEMKHERDALDGWCLIEESYDCPNRHYGYSYTTGYTNEYCNGKDFYTDVYNLGHSSLLTQLEYKIQRLLLKIEIKKSKIKCKFGAISYLINIHLRLKIYNFIHRIHCKIDKNYKEKHNKLMEEYLKCVLEGYNKS